MTAIYFAIEGVCAVGAMLLLMAGNQRAAWFGFGVTGIAYAALMMS